MLAIGSHDSPAPESSPPGAGLDAAFDAAYAEYRGLVEWIARDVLGNPEDAADCCQEVWMLVRRRLESFEGRGSLRAWVGVVAANKAKEVLRGRKRLRAVLEAALEVERYERRLAAAQGPRAADLHGPLLRAVRELEDLERRVIERRLARPDATLEEVAGELGLPRHKVKYAWKKALEQLRSKLREWEVGELLWLVLCVATGALHG